MWNRVRVGAKIALGLGVVLAGFAGILVFVFGDLGVSMVTSFLAPPFYRAGAIEGRVVDDVTGAPIEGAHVLASWELVNFRVRHAAWAHVAETVTDGDGRFVIPSWGPTLRWPPWGAMRASEPRLSVFVRGHNPWSEQSGYAGRGLWTVTRDYQWRRKLISLRPRRHRDSYVREVSGFAFGFHQEFVTQGCAWMTVPRFASEVRAAVDDLEKEGRWRDWDYAAGFARCSTIRR